MLVVEPSTLRFEEEAAARGQHEGQLVERISLLENNLLRFAERLEKGFELLLKQSQIALSDHALLETLIALLEETGLVDRQKLNELWRAALAGEKAGDKPKSTLEFLRTSIVEDYQGTETQLFSELVGQGLQSLADGKTARAKRELERAAALAPTHATLNFIIGLQFFREGKFTLARVYLERANEAQPESTQVYLLLGIASGDEGDIERARNLLHMAIEARGASYAAHYALGRLLASEDDWKGALVHFKGALAAKACAEGQYVVSLTLVRLGRLRTALRHANKAIEADENYAAAFQLLGFIQEQLGESKSAKKAFATARALGADGGAARRETKKRRADVTANVAASVAANVAANVSDETLLHAFFGASRHRQKRLLTGGDKRLAGLLREEALAQVGFGTLTPAR
jgi:tetratricopeptide (TPR) repeat protein